MNIFITISELFAGLVIPIPFFPDFLKPIVNILPFRYMGDLSFRLYSGHIPVNEAIPLILIQIIWIIILVVIGYLLTNKALKRVVVQGG
jgi:ABC-2 type transport system permease protein